MKNRAPLSLHIPVPEHRPGDAPDFRGIALPAAGAVGRPGIDAKPRAISDLAFSLIRVLDGEGRAVGEWNPKLDVETLRRGLKHMLLVRVFDDRMYRAKRQGKT